MITGHPTRGNRKWASHVDCWTATRSGNVSCRIPRFRSRECNRATWRRKPTTSQEKRQGNQVQEETEWYSKHAWPGNYWPSISDQGSIHTIILPDIKKSVKARKFGNLKLFSVKQMEYVCRFSGAASWCRFLRIIYRNFW